MSKFKPSRRGQINVLLNGLVSSGVVAAFRTNYKTREEPDPLRITVTRADGASAAAVQAKVLKALGHVGEGAKIIVELGDSQSQTEHLGAESEITGEQIRAARTLIYEPSKFRQVRAVDDLLSRELPDELGALGLTAEPKRCRGGKRPDTAKPSLGKSLAAVERGESHPLFWLTHRSRKDGPITRARVFVDGGHPVVTGA
ncbi:MAG: hypothetical protein ACJ8DE_18940 [Microvirga sp.]